MHGRPGARAEHHRLEKRIAGQPVGPVHAGGGTLSGGEKPLDRRVPVDIRPHPAHGVVGGRVNGRTLAAKVNAVAQAGLVNAGEARGHKLAAAV